MLGRMRRGKLCRMGGRPPYNHQAWRDGKNEVRYVPKDEAGGLEKDIAGDKLFMKPAAQYAGEAVRATRREREKKKRARKAKS